MTDRVYPSAAAKPAGTLQPPPPAAANGGSFAPPKPQLYNPARQTFRPMPKPRRRRSCCHCCCISCIWITIVILALILLAAIAAGVLWVLYRPQRPTFSVTSLRFSAFNLSSDDASSASTARLNSRLDIAVTARNPNKKLVFFYDPIAVDVRFKGADLGNGSFQAFVHGTKNFTTLRAVVSSGGPHDLDSDSAASLRSELKKKGRLSIHIQLETSVRVKMGGFKTKKVGIRVVCDQIEATIPKSKNSTAPAFAGSSSKPNCKVNLRFKLWKLQI